MRLSDLQTKEIINMTTGKKLGMIIDVIINNEGNIKSLILEEKRMKRLANREEYELDWKQIAKIGDDIILVKDKYAE
ncbi:MAG: YlmC/YmxH family sporulation protein [Bacilli bacterium]|nr:MAG: YlmC/YmxH family sporulation protein [Bacilli bacterium]